MAGFFYVSSLLQFYSMKKILFALVVLLYVYAGFGQAPVSPGISADTALAYIRTNYPQEKVFIQTDKAYYFPGETIWMKAWCSLDGMPTYLSRILYIELVNGLGEVTQKKMYKLDSMGSTPADMDLPEDIKSGNYTINAYTLWMLNFPEFVYHRNIYIYNVADYKKNILSVAPVIQMLFFPEGGDMIAGVKNRVAFKVLDKYGLPAQLKGAIVDNTGKKITDFSTEHDGMGVFEVEVETGKSYEADIPTTSGIILPFKLPAPKAEGIGIRVENTNPNRLFVLLSRAEKNKEKYGRLKVVAQIHHQLVFKADLNFDEGEVAAPISKKNLPPGILQITVFDAQGNPLAERLAFIENYTLTSPDIRIDTLNTKARGKNQFSFSIPNVTTPSLSCLVTSDLVDTAMNLGDNIASSFLMVSDLKGYIHNPGYYFKNKEAQTLHCLDLLLMTQGWRRFEWKKILQGNYTTLKYPVESAIAFRGTVTKSDRKDPVKDGRVSFIIKGEDSTSILADATLTDKGEFLLDNVHYMKGANVAYMGTNNKKDTYIVDVHLNPNYIDSLQKSAYIPVVDLDTVDLTKRRNSLAAYYIYGQMMQSDTSPFKNAKTLEGVVVKAKKLSKEDSLNREYAGGPFLLGKSIDPSAYKYSRTIWQVIQQTVPGVTIEGNPFDPTVAFNRFGGMGGDNNSFSVASSDGSISTDVVTQTNGIAYYLNEVNVSKDIINTLAVEDVALIKVLKNEGAVLGASQGVIAIYTKKGVVAGKAQYDKAYTVEKKAGYAITRQFYNPGYASNPGVKEADKRNTLYWNGRINPSKDGKYRFLFYNNDTGKKFKLVVQGIDKDGQLIYTERMIVQ